MTLDLNEEEIAIIRDCLEGRLTTLNNLALRKSAKERRADAGDRASAVNAVLKRFGDDNAAQT